MDVQLPSPRGRRHAVSLAGKLVAVVPASALRVFVFAKVPMELPTFGEEVLAVSQVALQRLVMGGMNAGALCLDFGQTVV